MTENFSSPTQTTVFLLALCPHLPAGVSTLVQASCRRSSERWSERILDQSCLSPSCLGSLLHKFLDPGTFLLSHPYLYLSLQHLWSLAFGMTATLPCFFPLKIPYSVPSALHLLPQGRVHPSFPIPPIFPDFKDPAQSTITLSALLEPSFCCF